MLLVAFASFSLLVPRVDHIVLRLCGATMENQEDKSENTVAARRVVLATGGLSYPETGSDGRGLEIARSLGHRIIPTLPALPPLLTKDPDWKILAQRSGYNRLPASVLLRLNRFLSCRCQMPA